MPLSVKNAPVQCPVTVSSAKAFTRAAINRTYPETNPVTTMFLMHLIEGNAFAMANMQCILFCSLKSLSLYCRFAR